MPTLNEEGTHPGNMSNFTTVADKCNDTQDRPLATGIDCKIHKPGVARASLAVSTERPEGDPNYAAKHAGYTTLQQHVMYFDTDNDGEIWVRDTYRGFRDLGFAIPFCLFCSPIIHFAFSYATRMAISYWPDPFFRIYVGGIHKAKHGSDTGVYDNEGRFRPQQFEEIFSKYDKDGDGGLTHSELLQMRNGNRVAADVFGVSAIPQNYVPIASLFEWSTIWLLLERDGKVWKEDLRGVYDGSLMWRIREKRSGNPEYKNDWGFGKDGYFTTCFAANKSKLG